MRNVVLAKLNDGLKDEDVMVVAAAAHPAPRELAQVGEVYLASGSNMTGIVCVKT